MKNKGQILEYLYSRVCPLYITITCKPWVMMGYGDIFNILSMFAIIFLSSSGYEPP